MQAMSSSSHSNTGFLDLLPEKSLAGLPILDGFSLGAQPLSFGGDEMVWEHSPEDIVTSFLEREIAATKAEGEAESIHID